MWECFVFGETETGTGTETLHDWLILNWTNACNVRQNLEQNTLGLFYWLDMNISTIALLHLIYIQIPNEHHTIPHLDSVMRSGWLDHLLWNKKETCPDLNNADLLLACDINHPTCHGHNRHNHASSSCSRRNNASSCDVRDDVSSSSSRHDDASCNVCTTFSYSSMADLRYKVKQCARLEPKVRNWTNHQLQICFWLLHYTNHFSSCLMYCTYASNVLCGIHNVLLRGDCA